MLFSALHIIDCGVELFFENHIIRHKEKTVMGVILRKKRSSRKEFLISTWGLFFVTVAVTAAVVFGIGVRVCATDE